MHVAHSLDVLEPDVAEHRGCCSRAGDPRHGCGSAIAGFAKLHRRMTVAADQRFDHQSPRRDLTELLENQERLSNVVENTETEDDVESLVDLEHVPGFELYVDSDDVSG